MPEALEFDASEVMAEIVGVPLRAPDSMRAREAEKCKGRSIPEAVWKNRPMSPAAWGIRGGNGVKHAGKSGKIRLHGAPARPHKYEGLEIR